MNKNEVAISMVYPILKAIVQKGYQAEHFFSYAHFDAGLLTDVEARIPGEELIRLTDSAAAYTKDEHFGLHQGQLMEFADMGIVGYVMMHSTCIIDALRAFQRYNIIISSGFNLDWSIRGEDVHIRFHFQHNGTLSRHCAEEMASSMYRLIGRLSNSNLLLKQIAFVHEQPEHTDPYLSVFGIMPQFKATENALVMSKSVLDYPVLYSDAKLLEVFDMIAESKKEELTQGKAFTEKIVQWLKICLPSFWPTLLQTAESFSMSPRTLQNKLKQENTTFNELSIEVRKEIALTYLRKKELSIGEIAYVLHFSEPSAFQNAFKKWVGVTPTQYRNSIGAVSSTCQ